jgi:hypothetical protein
MELREFGQLKAEQYDLAYWRKHPNLHGYIVEHFASGNDNSQPIGLSTACIKDILAAIENDCLPDIEGFSSGESAAAEKLEDIAIFTEILAWLETPDEDVIRSVYYQAYS